ncbi:MAG: lysylphosphatidylglycerol synthase transmembrane domain-containing protein [Bacteroidia bacterium]
MSKTVKNIVQYAIILAIGILFLSYVFNGIDWNDQLSRMKSANPYWLALGMAVSLLSHWFRAYRGILLYDALGYKTSSKNSFYAVLIGYMANYFIPRAGEVSRCASLSKTDGIPMEKSLGTVVTERVVDMFILLLILLVIFVLQIDLIKQFLESYPILNENSQGSSIIKWFALVVILLGFLAAYIFRKRISGFPLVQRIVLLLKGFAEGLLSIKNVRSPFLFILLSVLIWMGYIFMMYTCLFALEATSNLSFVDCLTVFAIGTIGIVLPAPGAGAGTYHFFVMQSLLLFGVQKEDGIAYATLVHGTQMVFLIAAGLIAVLMVFLQKKKKVNE